MDPALTCERLLIGYGQPLLPPMDLEVGKGQFWSVVGRNGTGKSTWFRTALGLVPALGGRCAFPEGREGVAYVAQRMAFDDLFPVQVHEVVAMGTLRGWSFLSPGRRSPTVRQAMEAVGVGHLTHRTFRTLSEGQKQRVLLARLVASQARVAFLDEPTAAMDAVAERETMGLLKEVMARQGMTAVVVSHHLSVAREFADRVLFLDGPDTPIVSGTPAQVFSHPAFRARYGEGEAP